MDSDLDELEGIADQNDVNYNYRDRRGRKRDHGHRATRKEQSRGRFKRIKKKPVTLPTAQPSKE